MSSSETKNDHLVKVFVRPRPFTKDELALKTPNVVHEINSNEIVLKSTNVEKKYNFDHVFSMMSSQTDVYDIAVSPLIDYILSGYTCTIFAYGQTGTGKTHTMIGNLFEESDENEQEKGMIPRAAFHLFEKLNQLNISYNVIVSFIEIYNEEVRDLLDYESSNSLKVYEDRDNKGATCIKGVAELEANSLAEVYDLLNIGISERHTASTKLNRNSSRSHTIFTIVVCTREYLVEGEEIIRTGKLHLIDLAGSENIGRSGATEMRAREAGTINKSLLTLGKVIKALALKMPHVPYRESKLTRILQDSLGGKSKTCMIATFSPCIESFEETISTLDYAHMARNVANCPTVNVNRNKTGVVKSSQEELMLLRQELHAARDGEGFYINSDTYEQINVDIKFKSTRISNLLLEVENMETATMEMQKRCDDLNSSFQRTNCNMKELETEIERETNMIKENEEAIGTTASKVSHLDKVTATLDNVCETSTLHFNIFHDKYQQQCDRTLHNAQLAGTVCDATAITFNEIKSRVDTLFDKSDKHVEEIGYELYDLYDCYTNKSNLLEFLASNIIKAAKRIHMNIDTFQSKTDYKKNNFKDFFINNLVKTEFFKSMNIFRDNQDERREIISRAMDIEEGRCIAKSHNSEQMLKKHLNSLKENSEKEKFLLSQCVKSLHVLLLSAERQLNLVLKAEDAQHILLEVYSEKRPELTNTLVFIRVSEHQPFDYYNLLREKVLIPFKEIIRAIGTFISFKQPFDRLKNEVQILLQEIEEDIRCLGQAESYFIRKGVNILEEFINTIIHGMRCKTMELQDCASQWALELKQIGAQLKNRTKEGDAIMSKQIRQIMNLQKTYTNDVALFIQQTVQAMNSFKENIIETVHAGDTPMKQSYQYPRNIKNELWQD